MMDWPLLKLPKIVRPSPFNSNKSFLAGITQYMPLYVITWENKKYYTSIINKM